MKITHYPSGKLLFNGYIVQDLGEYIDGLDIIPQEETMNALEIKQTKTTKYGQGTRTSGRLKNKNQKMTIIN